MSSPQNPKLVQRRERLEKLVVQKILRDHQKAGYELPDEEQVTALHADVTKMMQSGTLSRVDLIRLEQKLRERPCHSPQLVKRGESSRGNPLAFSLPTTIGTTKNTQPARSPSVDPWTQLAMKELEAFEKRQVADLARARTLKQQQKLALDEQVKARQQVRDVMAQQARVYAEQEAEQRKKWLGEQELIENKMKERYVAEKSVRDAQLQENRKRRQAEVEAHRKEDALIARRIKEDLEVEKQIETEKRMKAKADVARFLEYNQKQKALVAAHAQAEFESDKKHQEDALAALERQEQDRELALKRMFSRQSRQADMAAALQKGIEEQALLDEKKAKAEQERLRVKAEQDEQRRSKRVHEEREKLKAHLAEQMRLKEEQREQERREMDQLRAKLAQASKEAEQKDLRAREVRKELEQQHRRQLEQQIRQRQAVRTMEMTETEQKINRALLTSFGITKGVN